MQSPIVVDFPLKGEWVSPNTPGTKVPSHGTDLFGARYAYDFVGIDPDSRENRYFRPGSLRYLLFGVQLQDFFGWGRPIFAAAAGIVVQVEDGMPERNPVHPVRDFFVRFQNARAASSNPSFDFRTLTGNFIIIESKDGYAVYAHAQTGSIVVSPGERVEAGQPLAKVGHSGNSTAPHLHFQIMDHINPQKAQGIPCCFREYEVYEHDDWHTVQNGMPKTTDRIRK